MGSSQMLIALKHKYQAQIELSKNNIRIFTTDPTGVAEHIDYASTVEKELEKMMQARGLLLELDEILSDRHGSDSD
tara:strand:+ start:276 stop:503 length:228 start_codon:yes stop_codon:yes gene_type:complete